jgi:hypothetical protein
MNTDEEQALGQEYWECWEGGMEQSPRAREIYRKLTNEEERDPYKIHEKLMKEHGRYDRFDELMSEYSMNIRSLNITGVIVTICNFKEDVISRGLQNFMPIFHALEKRVMHIALEIARSGGGAR